MGRNSGRPLGVRPLKISIGRVPMKLLLPRDAKLRAGAIQRYRQFSATSFKGLPIFLRRKCACLSAAPAARVSGKVEGAIPANSRRSAHE